MVPTVELPPAMPLTCQLTAVLEVLDTVAVNCCVPPPACTEAPVGETETLIGAAAVVIVTMAEPLLVESAAETALTVTLAGAGTVAGPV